MSQFFLRFSSDCIIFFLFSAFFHCHNDSDDCLLTKKTSKRKSPARFWFAFIEFAFIEFSFIEIEVDVSFLHAARCSEGGSQRRENCDKELQNLSPSFLFHCHNRFVFKGLMIE